LSEAVLISSRFAARFREPVQPDKRFHDEVDHGGGVDRGRRRLFGEPSSVTQGKKRNDSTIESSILMTLRSSIRVAADTTAA
jgi:hypothetical protein